SPPLAATPAAADQVGGLVVTAAPRRAAPPSAEHCTTGPAWWRADNGSAQVWILGIPAQMPLDIAWDDTCFRLRLAAARLLISPPAGGVGNGGRTLMRPAKAPLNQRLPPALWDRLSRRMSDNAVRARDEMAARGLTRPPANPPPSVAAAAANAPEILRAQNPADLPAGVVAAAPLLYSPTLLVARTLSAALILPGGVGSPVAAHALDLAGRANMFTDRLKMRQAQLLPVVAAFSPSEADQEACLTKVLDELDAGHTALGLAPNFDAWAGGDYLDSPSRLNVLETCPYGQISVAFWSNLVIEAMAALERARVAGGVTVAILEFDPLLAKGGILDRLFANGWTITPPEDLK
ncbi:MAG: hypothetical protein JWM33_3965, partial [Caulobacteraceae bacterium]|nr:hypothetical protein [Caulobacteraceae bacterium]